MDKQSLINNFMKEIKDADQMRFPIAVDSFTNLWTYEFGSLDDLPNEIDDLIAGRALELGMLEDLE
ncbi:hypothetical protein EJF36_16050 [Bacillus sp. HMF5848]|nr:hypothetical protein [Bacillus sp. HMF5848]RSK29417.1 hypothetical protein EJF36_16050 [Bacillus sp. HMF5848]